MYKDYKCPECVREGICSLLGNQHCPEVPGDMHGDVGLVCLGYLLLAPCHSVVAVRAAVKKGDQKRSS